MQPKFRIAVLAAALLASSSAASAETTDCTEITAVPYVINAPGVYCLKSSVAGNDGIKVYSANVVIDLNGHTLEAPKFGVHTPVVVANVTVRNGAIRAATYAVLLQGNGETGYHRVEELRAQGMIAVAGNGAVVRGNLVTGAAAPAGGTGHYAIQVGEGAGIRVSDNIVLNSATSGQSESGGISLWKAVGAAVERNVISDAAPVAVPVSHGIKLYYSNGTMVSGNHVANLKQGVVNHSPSYPVLYRDNSVHGAATPFSGGVMVGATNVSF
jgi:hypothetical protein